MQRKNYVKKTAFPNGARLRVGVVVSEFNKDITEPMLRGALEALRACKVKSTKVRILRVPGSFEIPLGCLKLLKGGKCNAIVALGCVIKGETTHDVYIANAASKGIMDLSLQYGIPIAFGVITTNNLAQAKVRSTGNANKGIEAAITAVTMALLK
jgi:6,7-dimethyl-8-ribityllumazine synthase